ncbi:MAG: pyridoxal-phosphate dependent enzyme [Acidobacteria bacterium]|nr:pyridoxal-phosphate dependent enzyme [Acidobacteriota bacterium]MBV9476390.1 pyridoxal-phosphate dependent enzyme [Acidobacteriota bacterium]
MTRTIDIARAAARLASYASATPLVPSLLLSRELDCEVFVKNETVSPIASFKWRGALNAILREHAAPRGVVTSSTGNHGQGVAWAARTAGIPAHIFLPLGANPTKRAKIALLGATIHDIGHDLDAAKELAIQFARDEELLFVDDGESDAVIEGAGTIGREIAQTLDAVDVVYTGMGSGSLASGVAIAVKERFPQARIVTVQAKGSPAMVESFHARRAIERPIETRIADGLVARVPARLALELLLAYVDDAIAVSDDELLAATRAMILSAQLLVEPSGAAALAGALQQRASFRGKRVVLIATGANLTAELFARLHDGTR